MKCNDFRDKFADFLAGDMDAVERAAFDAHLAECPACSAELRTLSETWTKLGVLPQERPSAGLSTRFYTMLEAYRDGLKEERAESKRTARKAGFAPSNLWARRPAFQLGAAVLLLVVGLAAGYRLSRPAGGSLVRLHQEVQDMRQMLAVSMLKQSSPFDRLQGASLSQQITAPDRATMQTLFQTLDNDPNVNVRLAAVDALYLFMDQPGVKEQVMTSLAHQDSPLIQAALIDLVVSARERRAVEALRLLLQDKNLNPQVKQKAVRGIQQLTA
jgi:anti-sigma factor RsiW